MGMPGYPMQNMPGTPMSAPQPMMQQPMSASQPMMRQPIMAAPTQWQAPPQATPSLGYLASGVNPGPPPATKVRGVSADPAPTPPPAPAKIRLPSPEELGVTARSPMPARGVPAPPVDWNTAHARIERLGVLRYQKDVLPAGGVRVTLLLPTANPALGQPVEAVEASEAAALALALERAEAWMQRR